MTPIRAQLREATRTGHERLEATMGLSPGTMTLERYGVALQVLQAVRAAWEPAIGRYVPGVSGGHLVWLGEDLRCLGLLPIVGAPALPACCAAEAWGVQYVLEGSALGGQVLLRGAAQLGLSAERGARYFAGGGLAVGARWAGFLAGLEVAAGELGSAGILAGAMAGFAGIERFARGVG